MTEEMSFLCGGCSKIGCAQPQHIEMLKCGCGLLNLANNGLHKSFDGKFCSVTERDQDLLQKF